MSYVTWRTIVLWLERRSAPEFLTWPVRRRMLLAWAREATARRNVEA